jgi:hypothetical protein
MFGRRQLFRGFTGIATAFVVGSKSRQPTAQEQTGELLNDVQSQLNPTRVAAVLRPKSVRELEEGLVRSRKENKAISVAGGRHSMGGQQFGTNNLHLDMTGLNRVLQLDVKHGLVTVEAGIQWPELIEELHRRQSEMKFPWTIREKQTGVDAVCVGGSISSNVHGRALKSPPIICDIESFTLLDADGKVHNCSRQEDPELFSLVIGGYGLFGIITDVTLRLARQFKVRRRVQEIAVKDLLDLYQQRVDSGFVFGDCQYSADLDGEAESHPGIFPCYEPVMESIPLTENPKGITKEQWAELYKLMRSDKPRAYKEYRDHYLQTDGQVYLSDKHQLATAFVGHRAAVKARRRNRDDYRSLSSA